MLLTHAPSGYLLQCSQPAQAVLLIFSTLLCAGCRWQTSTALVMSPFQYCHLLKYVSDLAMGPYHLHLPPVCHMLCRWCPHQLPPPCGLTDLSTRHSCVSAAAFVHVQAVQGRTGAVYLCLGCMLLMVADSL